MFPPWTKPDPEKPKRVEAYEGYFDLVSPIAYNYRSMGYIYRSAVKRKSWGRIVNFGYLVMTADMHVIAITENRLQAKHVLWSLSAYLLPCSLLCSHYVKNEIAFVDTLSAYCCFSFYVPKRQKEAVTLETFRKEVMRLQQLGQELDAASSFSGLIQYPDQSV